MQKCVFSIAMLALFGTGIAFAQHDGAAPYAGSQKREIASLSEQDLMALREGKGWGLALPAEVNGAPGPSHLLELSEELDLTTAQVSAITTIYDEMTAAAISAGEAFITAEKALNDAFKRGGLEEVELAKLAGEAGDARTKLRLIHLAAHLKTLPVLTDEQIAGYSRLRGYGDQKGKPCASVPEGHDPVMWRKHNGCL